MAQIIWTERSKLDYWDNIEYLEREWTEKEIIRFNKKTNEVLSSLLQENVVFKSTNLVMQIEFPPTKNTKGKTNKSE